MALTLKESAAIDRRYSEKAHRENEILAFRRRNG
jgi:hypothetical protein